MLQLLKYGKENRKYLFIQSLLAWLPKLSLSVLIYMILAENGFNITNLIAISVLVLVQVIYSLFFKDKVNNQYGYKAKKEFRGLYLNAFYKKDRDVDKAEVLQKEIMGLGQVDSFYQIFFPSLIQFMWGYIGLLLLSIHFGVNLWLLPFFYMISIGLSMAILGNGGKKKNRKFVEVFTSLGARFLNDLAGMNTLIMYQADYNYQKAFEVESEDYRKKTMDVLFFQLQSISVLNFFLYTTIILAGLSVSGRYISGDLELALAISLFIYFTQLILMASSMGYFFHVYASSKPSIDSVLKLIEDTKDDDGLADLQIDRFNGLELKHLYLGFSNRILLSDVNLKLDRCGIYALVGYNGSGKSTLAKTIMAWQKPNEGSVYVNDTDLFKVNQNSWLKHISYLSSNSYLFEGSIADNIAMSGDTNWRDNIDKYGLCAFAKDLDQGFDTQVGEGGRLLSYGQRQQVALAREILADKDVYILDEVASNLDQNIRDIIISNIKQMAADKLVVLISHNWEEVAMVDSVLWIDNGDLRVGSHRHLMENNQNYKELVRGGKQ